MKRNPITTAQDALKAHNEAGASLTGNAKKQHDKATAALEQAANEEIAENEKELPDEDAANTSGGTETKVEAKTESKEKEKPKKAVVKITSALYGRDDKTIEVSKYLNELNNGGHGRKITNKLFGGNDPYKNKIKQLTVDYTVDGVAQKTVTCMENEKLELVIPEPVATTADAATTATAATAEAATAATADAATAEAATA